MTTSIHKYMVTAAIALGGFGLAGSAESQIVRERYQMVEPAELVEFPQRFWSRGIVFEDVLIDAKGREARVGGRSYARFKTRRAGDLYVGHAAMSGGIRWQEGRGYLFAGTVVSETVRGLPFSAPSSRYYIVIDAVEPLVQADEVAGMDWLTLDAADRPALRSLQQAVQSAQRELLARAENEGIPMPALFDVDNPTADRAAESARVAVRQLEVSLGYAGAEILSRLVRELLAEQYQREPIPVADGVWEEEVEFVLPTRSVEPLAVQELEAETVESAGEWVEDIQTEPLPEPEPVVLPAAVIEPVEVVPEVLGELKEVDVIPAPETPVRSRRRAAPPVVEPAPLPVVVEEEVQEPEPPAPSRPEIPQHIRDMMNSPMRR